jgi:hypothetical protein
MVVLTVAGRNELTLGRRLAQKRQLDRVEKRQPGSDTPEQGHQERVSGLNAGVVPVSSVSRVNGHDVLFLSLVAAAQIGWISGLSFALYSFLR